MKYRNSDDSISSADKRKIPGRRAKVIRRGLDKKAHIYSHRNFTLREFEDQITSKPENWNGFEDPFWNLGQVVLWIATKDPALVDAASDASGQLGKNTPSSEIYGLIRAALAIQGKGLTGQQARDAVVEVKGQCMDGKLFSTTDGRPISAEDWRHLEIVVREDILMVVSEPNAIAHATPDLRFSRENVLRCFPPSSAVLGQNLVVDDTDARSFDITAGMPHPHRTPTNTALPSSTAANTLVATSSDFASTPRKKTGPRPLKRERVAAEMRKDIAEGAITWTDLGVKFLDKQLEAKYGHIAQRTKIREARDDLLKEHIISEMHRDFEQRQFSLSDFCDAEDAWLLKKYGHIANRLTILQEARKKVELDLNCDKLRAKTNSDK
jgi:hypothetical protein